MWVPDTQHNVDDAACSLVYRLKQHLGSQAHADQLSQSKYEETVQAAEVVVTEYNEDKTTAPIIRKRKMDVDEAPPREPPQAQPLVVQPLRNPRWSGNRGSSSSAGLPVVEGMNMDKQERARRYLATLGTSELRDMVRLVMDEFQQRESRGL